MNKININNFISKKIIKRSKSLFQSDIKNNLDIFQNEINNKSVLVIGGAGSIGSSFIKSILNFSPSKIVVVDINENALTELTRDLRSSFQINMPNDYRTYPLSYNNEIFYRFLQNEGYFDIIANFAAHKHVRSEKNFYSICSMFENNVFGNEKLLSFLKETPPKHFFCVSTDKAANPVNLMGASKRLMEDVIFSFSDDIKISTARFANVAFSNGSLLDGFINRISKQQPLTAPLDIKRFFVSPIEAGELCLIACILGNNKEIFYPKISPNNSISFSQVSDLFLNEIGYQPLLMKNENDAKFYAKSMNLNDTEKKYPVFYFNSDTTGEKEIEEFFGKDEIRDEKKFSSLGIIKYKHIDNHLFNKNILKLKNILVSKTSSKLDVVEVMQDLVKNFHHDEKNKNLDQKM